MALDSSVASCGKASSDIDENEMDIGGNRVWDLNMK